MPLVASVAVAAPLEKTLSYLVPEDLASKARVGVRLQVPLGRRSVTAFLLELFEGEAPGLRAIGSVLDEDPLFAAEMVPFFRWAADYYRHPLGEVIRAALPAGLSGANPRVGIRHETVYLPSLRDGEPSGPRQREILAHIRKKGAAGTVELGELFPSLHGPLRRLEAEGFLIRERRERLRDPFLDRPAPPDRPVVPTADQEAALGSIEEASTRKVFAPFLLHGVTGSGKTEVYLRAIARVLEDGGRSLVLVPEISLTPQLVSRFRGRFPAARLAVLHSGLGEGERYDAWRTIARGDVDIVIGARSAVFAPVRHLGIIIVDEEHESSYKQAEGFRYNARDLALLRGQMDGAVVLLGSATPSLSTYHRAMEGKIGYLPLTTRAMGRPLPEVVLADLAAAPPEGSLSAVLVDILGETLSRGEQALLLLNRRGFAPYLLCGDCGATFRCPNCEITLTFYQGKRLLRCHYCDYAVPPPDSCPGCRSASLKPEGAGTERLEEELAAIFPTARIARMDRDTTSRKGAHQQIVDEMEQARIDILVGTQMIAKGHDFPLVTMVGVVGADQSLNFPDFRSAERTFALLTQVAGRAGRGDRPGRVVVQTWTPDHYAITCAANHDYRGFYEQEIAFRRELGYPPFGHLVNLVVAGIDPKKVQEATGILSEELRKRAGQETEVLGPAPCPLVRLRGKTRMQILLKAPARAPLRRILAALEGARRVLPTAVALAVDVDPLDML